MFSSETFRYYFRFKLNFNIHVDKKIKKRRKIMVLIKRLWVSVPRKVLLSINKSFIRQHLDFRDMLYDKPKNQHFQNKFESSI